MQQSIKNDFRLLVECEYPSISHFLADFNTYFGCLSLEKLKKHLDNPDNISKNYDKMYLTFFDIIKNPKNKQYFYVDCENFLIFEKNLN